MYYNRNRKDFNLTKDEKFLQEFNEYNKLMKRLQSKTMTLAQYTKYRSGRLRVPKKGVPLSPLEATPYRRQSPVVPSGDGIGKDVAKRAEMQYTGTLITGIATMHKSNAVPVINQQQAEEISRMAR